MKVIETNLSLQVNNEILDHQSRVIEVDSWEEYVDEIRNGKSVRRCAAIGSMSGNTLHNNVIIENFESDEFHLSCEVKKDGTRGKTKKLAYLIN